MIENIKKGIEIRSNLIQLKEWLKEASDVDAFLQSVNVKFFRKLLKHDDAKVRKNIVQIIGMCDLESLVDEVYDAYEQEEVCYVRPEYLKVLKNFPMKEYVSKLQERQQELEQKQDYGENEKHVAAELRELNRILKDYGVRSQHRFDAKNVISMMILTTLTGREKYVKKEVESVLVDGRVAAIRGGVKIETDDYENLFKIRSFQELLFVVPGCQQLHGNCEEIAEQILDAGFLDYIRQRMTQPNAAFSFRFDVRGKIEAEEKRTMMKRISSKLEICSKHQLVNDASDYEIELRLLKRKDQDSYRLFLKIMLLEDRRFRYRTHSVATSVPPYVAALCMQIAAPYTKGRGQVLDPFCGVGTMLIEKNYQEHCHSIYGVDIFKNAIDWAQEHTEKARMDIHYIQKDMKDFSHKYAFDLLVTDLPVCSSASKYDEMERLYECFFEKCLEWLENKAVLVIYSQMPELFERVYKKQSRFKMLLETDMYKEGKTKLYILKYRNDVEA